MLIGVVMGDGVTTDLIPDNMKQRIIAGGSADEVAEQIKAKVLDAGIDSAIIHIPTQTIGYQPGQIAALGAALRPLIAA
jgi:hypothetical protein